MKTPDPSPSPSRGRPPKKRTRPWRTDDGIRVRPLKMRSGAFAYRAEIPESITGRRILKQFKTAQEAESYAAVMVVQRKNNGLSGFSLTDDQRADAKRALEMLTGAGLSTPLSAAAEFYISHARPVGGDITVGGLVTQYLEAKRRKELRPRSIGDLSSRLRIFASTFGDGMNKDITAPEIERWLFDDPALSSQSRRNFRTVLNGLCKYAVGQKYLAENPVLTVTNPIVGDCDPAILTVEQASALLHAALFHPQLELLPYVALGLFCGLRSCELDRIEWEAVDLKSGRVTVGPLIAKKRRIRVVEIPECCRSWLTSMDFPAKGKIRPTGFDRRWDKLLAVADHFGGINRDGSSILPSERSIGLLPWRSNALRHSAGSYHYARYGNAAQTCFMLGQKDDQVLFDHYRSLVKPEDAAAFYNLYPRRP